MRPSENEKQERGQLEKCIGDSCMRLKEQKKPASDAFIEAVEQKLQKMRERFTKAIKQ